MEFGLTACFVIFSACKMHKQLSKQSAVALCYSSEINLQQPCIGQENMQEYITFNNVGLCPVYSLSWCRRASPGLYFSFPPKR